MIEILLTSVFLIFSILYVHKNSWRVGVQIEIQLRNKTSGEKITRLDINDLSPQKKRIDSNSQFQTISFPLPRQEIKNLKINFGKNSDQIAIKTIKIKNLLNSFRLSSKQLPYHFPYRHEIKQTKVNNNCYFIKTTNSNHWLAPHQSFYQKINKLQQDKTIPYLLCIIFSLVFFYLIYFLSFTAWRNLLKPKFLFNGGLIFIIVVFIPLTDKTFKIFNKFSLIEKRKLAKKPEFRLDSLASYLKQYNQYYNDHFKFRSPLIFYNNLIKTKVWNISPTPKVLLGKDGWLFFDKPDIRQGTVDYYRSITLFSTQELKQWKRTLEQRYQWLRKNGIHYFFLIVPNKNSIYPEFMPDYIQKVHKKSRMDQLIDYLEKHSQVPILDIRPALKAAKKLHPVYSKTDTHWNDFGAYIAHREIINYSSRYFKTAKPIPLSQFKIEIDNHMGGDLAIMLSLHQEILRENIIRLIPKNPLCAKTEKLNRLSRFIRQCYTYCPSAQLPNVVMVHDSFYHRLKPYLSEKFSKIVYIWDWNFNFYPNIIKNEKPALVIDEMAERFLMGEIPKNPKMIMQHMQPIR